MAELLARLKQRKLVQWAIAYVAFAFALFRCVVVPWPAPPTTLVIPDAAQRRSGIQLFAIMTRRAGFRVRFCGAPRNDELWGILR